jgi:uncharacterized protein YndB with AHSA1/START domain
MSSTRITHHVNAPRAMVYRALLDASAISKWMVPNGMTSHVHAFDAREGGSLRISLTYDAQSGTGKTAAHTDTFHGRFVKLVANKLVVEVVEFETTDPALRGEMTITYALTDADGGTDILGVHDRLPSGVSTTDNETGWRMSLAKLAALVEAA